jgi:hypothetical protein
MMRVQFIKREGVGPMSVQTDYARGVSAGESAAGRTLMDQKSAELVLLALVERDPSVTVELSLPPTHNGEYLRGYVKGWQRQLVLTARRITDE